MKISELAYLPVFISGGTGSHGTWREWKFKKLPIFAHYLDTMNPFQEPDQELVELIKSGFYADHTAEDLRGDYSQFNHLATMELSELSPNEWRMITAGTDIETFTRMWRRDALDDWNPDPEILTKIARNRKARAAFAQTEEDELPTEPIPPRKPRPLSRKKQVVSFDELETEVDRKREFARRERRRNVGET